MDSEEVLRLEVRLQDPNPVFKKWIETWLRDAEEKNSKSKYSLREALESLRRYPLPLKNGRQCAILRGFGKKLCTRIDEELKLARDNHTKDAEELEQDMHYEDEVQQVVEEVQRRRGNLVNPKLDKKIQERFISEQIEEDRQVSMSPGSFRIRLLVDTQETVGNNKKVMDKTIKYLESHSVPFEVRRLAVGDFMWIAVDKEGNDLVLPFVVERKRLDDLAMSIRDGRFHEQKHRLRNSGIQNVIYLIEDIPNRQHCGLPYDTLQQAIANTQIHSNFNIVNTCNHHQTMQYLEAMTKLLVRLYKDKVLIGTNKADLQPHHPADDLVGLMKFIAVNKESASCSQLTVRELFVQQLLQLHSLSLEKAVSIVEQYPTPRLLFDAYSRCKDAEEGRKLLASLRSGPLKRPIGEKISRILYDFYCSEFQ